MASLLNIGRGLVNHKFLPYDAEIEYLESSGTQYIDTGIKPTNTFKIDLELAKVNLNRQDGICGSYDGVKWGMYLYIAGTINANVGRYACAYGTNNIFITDVSYNDTNKHHVILDLTSGGLKTFVDNNLISTNSYSPINNNTNYYLFRCNDGNVSSQRIAIIKLYYFKIYSNDTLVRDFIPVRIGTTGYMYDKVSKQLFGNAGTDSFILGPDKH